MDVTRKRISRILELREILLSFQTGLNLVNAAVVCAILESISGFGILISYNWAQVFEACEYFSGRIKAPGLQLHCLFFLLITALWVTDSVVILALHETVGIMLGVSSWLLEESLKENFTGLNHISF